MPDLFLDSSFWPLLQSFSPCFTQPSFCSFVLLCAGWILTLGRHTVTSVVKAQGAYRLKHISSFYRFFSRACWAKDQVGLVLVGLVVSRLPQTAPVIVLCDDTLARHTGKTIAGASMHHDPLLSSKTRKFFHFGHLWVVVGIHLEFWGKNFCLPVLCRLYRSKAVCERDNWPFFTPAQLCIQLVCLLAQVLPQRQFYLVGDASYTNQNVLKHLPPNVHFVGRGRLDAALYAPCPPRRRRAGRPQVHGPRILSPQQQAQDSRAPWREVDLTVYHKQVKVKVLVIDALWYKAAGARLVRLVVVRGFPGHDKDDVFVCTEVTLEATAIITLYSLRWSIEVTIEEAKGKLGLEQPQTQAEQSVERNAPMALWTYSLIVLWYLDTGQFRKEAVRPRMPWYPDKEEPTFSDMLATLRRATWKEAFSACQATPQEASQTWQKCAPLFLDYLDAVT
jgi:DDE superfamily endonuclease